MPTFTLGGSYLIYFAAYRKHIGMYPAPLGDADLADELLPYAAGKGTLRFPLDKPIPFDLISKVVKSRAMETLARAATRDKRSK
jgi:uncharacterized protein YdhG (YjbR/CyaY superfamily)